MKKILIIMILFFSFFQNIFSENNENWENLPWWAYIWDYYILKDVEIFENKITFSDSIILWSFIKTENIFSSFRNFKDFAYEIEYFLKNFWEFLTIPEKIAYYNTISFWNENKKQKYSLWAILIQKWNLNKEKNVKEIYYIAELTCDKNWSIIINSWKYKNFPAWSLGNSKENFYKYFKNCDDLENFFDRNKRFKLSVDSFLDIRYIIFFIILWISILIFITYKIFKKFSNKKI